LVQAGGVDPGYCLRKEGVPVTIFEGDPESVGGISRTAATRTSASTSAATALFEIAGSRGPVDGTAARRLLRARARPHFLSRQIFLSTRSARSSLPSNSAMEIDALRLLVFARAAFSNAQSENFQGWVTNQFGARLFRIFFRPTPKSPGA